MNKTALLSPKESVPDIAELFRKSERLHLTLLVKEDLCFRDWLDVGKIVLNPGPVHGGEDGVNATKEAVKHGFYEWRTRNFADLKSDCMSLMATTDKNEDEKGRDVAENKTRRALAAIIDVGMRLGLLFPRFDPDMISELQSARPFTVVTDTNAIGKGGVDFLVRFLSPRARLKVPAIVAMEIINQSDNFFEKRRSALGLGNKFKQKAKADMLLDHVVSQGAQRAMLRFELHSDIAIERTPLMSDPLRNAFETKTEPDWHQLKTSVPLKSYCDRLILETARQHLSVVTPGHDVVLMTGDEGLARMSLAEGIRPFFYHAGRPPEMYGQTLVGTRFEPFSGKVFSVPLQNLLWELAVTFGNARLATDDGRHFFEVCAIAQDLNWQPFHAKDDLLRVISSGSDSVVGSTEHSVGAMEKSDDALVETVSLNISIDNEDSDTNEASDSNPQVSSSRPKLGPFRPDTIYPVDLSTLLELMNVLLTKTTIPFNNAGTPIYEKAQKTQRRYLGFLALGGFIEETETGIRATETLQQLWDTLKQRDMRGAEILFRSVGSFDSFLNELKNTGRLDLMELSKLPESKRPGLAYQQISEIIGLSLKIPKDGIYGTFFLPTVDTFVDKAVQAYESLKKDEDYVLTGLWLETLARDHGIHPLTARDRLSEAHAAKRLERYTQGSTPDTRFENHTLSVLKFTSGNPVIENVCLYHGGFVIPGKASVSIRLERK